MAACMSLDQATTFLLFMCTLLESAYLSLHLMAPNNVTHLFHHIVLLFWPKIWALAAMSIVSQCDTLLVIICVEHQGVMVFSFKMAIWCSRFHWIKLQPLDLEAASCPWCTQNPVLIISTCIVMSLIIVNFIFYCYLIDKN